jgi:hypothetical protein
MITKLRAWAGVGLRVGLPVATAAGAWAAGLADVALGGLVAALAALGWSVYREVQAHRLRAQLALLHEHRPKTRGELQRDAEEMLRLQTAIRYASNEDNPF